ncbi:GNAT family N-acetyltransferase [Parasphingorhabdus litoris]|uniref:GNAT family N-acetyltransferase n=1 Tax=Parasphingorhabdus litoris TaxID=394733 RepID=A0ABN1AHT7_9SPHN|nr:GNAT family N-acetyltransferase [Parasphingorhabdus litoris]
MNIDDIRIETERLILRPPNADDFEGWSAFQADAETMTFIGGVKSRSESWRDLCGMVGAWHVRGYAMFSLILKDSNQWIGRIGPWNPEGWPGTEVGWALAPDFAGKGYALEAAVASMNYVVDTLGWTDVCHTIDPENLASIKLAERLGSTNRGPTKLPPPYHDARVDDWGQSREQWLENRKQFQ